MCSYVMLVLYMHESCRSSPLVTAFCDQLGLPWDKVLEKRSTSSLRAWWGSCPSPGGPAHRTRPSGQDRRHFGKAPLLWLLDPDTDIPAPQAISSPWVYIPSCLLRSAHCPASPIPTPPGVSSPKYKYAVISLIWIYPGSHISVQPLLKSLLSPKCNSSED